MRRLWPWIAVWAFSLGLGVYSTQEALERYRELRSGWSWDLAYYNQWYWALAKGDGILSVRPLSSYGEEGPSVWKMNYLSPMRFLLVPIYAMRPDPTTLLAIHGAIFWWVIPAAFSLARSESGSTSTGLSAAGLATITPLLWPLAWNDFRELQVAIPFVLWAVQGYRARTKTLAAIGIGGMLACRQEFAIVVASMAILPPKVSEDAGRTRAWSKCVFYLGLCWMLFGFFGYLRIVLGARAPEMYIDQLIGGGRAPIGQTLGTALEFLVLGMGVWGILACFAPRVFLLALPWLWSLAGGRWALRFIGTEEWHHVRYTAIFVSLTLAAGIVGYANLMARLPSKFRRGLPAIGFVGLLWPCLELSEKHAGAPRPISVEEAAEVWRFIEQVQPDDGVLADYQVSAPLSSRRLLSSYILDANKPKGYPRLGPEYRWVFLNQGRLAPQILLDQGFELLFRGPFTEVYRAIR